MQLQVMADALCHRQCGKLACVCAAAFRTPPRGAIAGLGQGAHRGLRHGACQITVRLCALGTWCSFTRGTRDHMHYYTVTGGMTTQHAPVGLD